MEVNEPWDLDGRIRRSPSDIGRHDVASSLRRASIAPFILQQQLIERTQTKTKNRQAAALFVCGPYVWESGVSEFYLPFRRVVDRIGERYGFRCEFPCRPAISNPWLMRSCVSCNRTAKGRHFITSLSEPLERYSVDQKIREIVDIYDILRQSSQLYAGDTHRAAGWSLVDSFFL